jgi:hypothetical protein
MKYTLIMPNGKIMQFYLEAIAELYQTINGGVIVTDEILSIDEVKEFENV